MSMNTAQVVIQESDAWHVQTPVERKVLHTTQQMTIHIGVSRQSDFCQALLGNAALQGEIGQGF